MFVGTGPKMDIAVQRLKDMRKYDHLLSLTATGKMHLPA
jgi:hypothetical protein